MGLQKLNSSIEKIKKARKEADNEGGFSLSENLKKTIDAIKSSFHDTGFVEELSNKISSIRESYIENWNNENLSYVEEVVEKTDLSKGIPAPVLSVCGRGTREIRFTRYLAYYLNPEKNHGLHNHLLKRTLTKEAEEAGLDTDWHENCEVKSEYKLGNITFNHKEISCYVDIAILGDKFIIIIENKILADESEHPEVDLGQLKRYDLALERNESLKDYEKVKIYLKTGAGDKSESSDWIAMNYNTIIKRGIKLLQQDFISDVAGENLMRLLLDLSLGPHEIHMDFIEDINETGKEIIESDSFSLNKSLNFDRLTNEHELIINILLEGL